MSFDIFNPPISTVDAEKNPSLNLAPSDPSENVSNLEEKQPPQVQSEKSETVDQTKTLDDVSSDTDEIREQAEQSRDPEQGKNII